MITILSINIEGFCSIQQVHLQLNYNTTVLIKAPNGSGKSSLFSALVWCLYGKNLKGNPDVNTWKNVRPKDYKGTKVELFFQRDDDVYKVVRCQNYKGNIDDGTKGNNRLLFLKNNVSVDIKYKAKIQDTINHRIGMTYELFMNSIMFGQGIKRLIQESNTDKRKLFEEVFDLNFLNMAKGIAQDDKDNIISQMNEVEMQANSLKKELESNKGTYFELRERERKWKNTVHIERKHIREKKLELESMLKKEHDKIINKTYDDLIYKITKKENKIKDIRKELKLAQSISNIPLEEFLDDILKLLKKHDIKSAYHKLIKVRKSFTLVKKYNHQLQIENDRLYNLIEDKNRYNDIKSTCSIYKADLDRLDDKLNDIKNEKLKILSPKYKAKIHELRLKFRKVDEDYHNKVAKLKDYEWLISDPLGNNGIKAYLFDSSLDILNKTLSTYSDILGFKIEFDVELESNRKDFVTLIERDNNIIDYEDLSGGEKTLVNLTMAIAMHEVLTATRGINILFLDEVFDALDESNIELVLQLLTKIGNNKTIFLITHLQSLPFTKCKNLMVEKVNGLTSYKLV